MTAKKTTEAPRKPIGMIIGTIAVIVIVAIAIICMILVNRQQVISSVEEFKEAIKAKRAVNCTMQLDGEEMTFQTSDGFERVKVITADSDLSEGKQYTLMVKGEGIYYWDEAGTIAFKSSDAAEVDSFLEDLDTVTDEDIDAESEEYNLNCAAADQASLIPPSNIDFVDLSEATGDEEE